MSNNSWLHLDLKGVVPSSRKFCVWLDYFKRCGFEEIVLEYDCRVEWDSWPGAALPRFTKDEIRGIVAYAAKIGLAVIPLVQIQGHLEWILKHERYAELRENDFVNELCPQHPKSAILIKTWINEVLELHPGINYIHLGADETWNLGSCEKCQEVINRNPERGKMGIYVDHVSTICRHVIDKGLRPLIWADMFCNDNADLVQELPPETILVNWQYTGVGPFESVKKLQATGLEIWGASAIQCSWYEHWWSTLDNPGKRLENIYGWQQSGLNVIHTVWGRPGNLWNLYGSWHMSAGLFAAAGNPERWQKHPWKPFFERLSGVMLRDWPHELKSVIKEVIQLPAEGEIEIEGRKWLELGLRYQLMVKNYMGVILGRKCMDETAKYVGRDSAVYHKYYILPLKEIATELPRWKSEVEEFWTRNELSDVEEFIAEKCAVLTDR